MGQQVSLRQVRAGVNRFLAIAFLLMAADVLLFSGSSLQAQRIVTAGPPSVRRPLNIPPSVTSIENHMPPFLPNAPASVTSISPYNFNTRPYVNAPVYPYGGRYGNCRFRGCNGYGGYGYGYSYAVPYYYVYPSDDSSYYGPGGGPYLYSGPPQGQAVPAEQTLHIIVDTPPARSAPEIADEQPERSLPAPAIPDAKPGVPTTLVFRDGHKQEVTNYAIMGQTVYVFGDRTKKIALADLDIPATVKVNDDEGVEFQVPKTKQSEPAKSGVPLQSSPDDSSKTRSSMRATP